jgi:uncharacterized protein YkwD
MKTRINSSKTFIALSLFAFVLSGLTVTSPLKVAEAASRPAKRQIKIVRKANRITKRRIVKRIVHPKPVIKPVAQIRRPATGKVAGTPAVKAPAPVASTAPKPVSCPKGSFQSEFMCLLNNYRVSNGKSPLSYDTNLQRSAQYYSSYMNEHKSPLSHTADGNLFYKRCEMNGTTCRGENVAWNFNTSPQALFEAWRKSPGHNANMLGNYTTTGLALSGAYATNLFR